MEKASLRYGTQQEKQLDSMSTAEARRYLEAGEFEAGSMEPKIQAAVEFIGNSAVRRAVITKLDGETIDITGQKGTVIYK